MAAAAKRTASLESKRAAATRAAELEAKWAAARVAAVRSRPSLARLDAQQRSEGGAQQAQSDDAAAAKENRIEIARRTREELDALNASLADLSSSPSTNPSPSGERGPDPDPGPELVRDHTRSGRDLEACESQPSSMAPSAEAKPFDPPSDPHPHLSPSALPLHPHPDPHQHPKPKPVDPYDPALVRRKVQLQTEKVERAKKDMVANVRATVALREQQKRERDVEQRVEGERKRVVELAAEPHPITHISHEGSCSMRGSAEPTQDSHTAGNGGSAQGGASMMSDSTSAAEQGCRELVIRARGLPSAEVEERRAQAGGVLSGVPSSEVEERRAQAGGVLSGVPSAEVEERRAQAGGVPSAEVEERRAQVEQERTVESTVERTIDDILDGDGEWELGVVDSDALASYVRRARLRVIEEEEPADAIEQATQSVECGPQSMPQQRGQPGARDEAARFTRCMHSTPDESSGDHAGATTTPLSATKRIMQRLSALNAKRKLEAAHVPSAPPQTRGARASAAPDSHLVA